MPARRVFYSVALFSIFLYGMGHVQPNLKPATYEILARLDILKSFSTGKTAIKIFYPRKLRKRLFKVAGRKGWKVERQEGSKSRV